MPQAQPRLLVVSSTYAAVENRKKLEALSQHFEVGCLTCLGYSAFGVEFAKQEADVASHYELHRLLCWGDPGSSTRYALRGLAKHLRAFQPDVVIVEQEPWALVRWQARWAIAMRSQKILFGEFSWENFRRPSWKGAALQAVYSLAMKSSDFVISGNRLGGELWRSFGLPEKRLLVSPQMGIDPVRYSPCSQEEKVRLRRAWGFPEKGFIVGFAGRLTQCKGVDQLVAAFEKIKAGRAFPEAHLCLLGGGNLKPKLEARAGGVDWLQLPAPVDHAGVADFLKCLDLFVHASRPALNDRGEVTFIEQSPYALGQAMLTGLPCIAGATGAIVDIMEGLPGLIGAGDEAALLRELQSCLGSAPEERAARGSLNRQKVTGRWTNDIVAAQWAGFIKLRLNERL